MEEAPLGRDQKKARRLSAHIAFLDESGFMLFPTRCRTWGPRGCTPLMDYSYRHDRISAIAALTVSPKRHRLGLYLRLRQHNFNATAVASFLRALLKKLRGHVILIWDGAKIHKGPIIAGLASSFPRLHLERLPAYAPELNPVEASWSNFKRPTRTPLLLGKQDVRLALHARARRARQSQQLLQSFFRSSDLPSLPW